MVMATLLKLTAPYLPILIAMPGPIPLRQKYPLEMETQAATALFAVFANDAMRRVASPETRIAMTTGMLRGLSREDAARFSFLLATPVILAAGVLKMPTLFAPENHASLGPALVGSVIAGVASYISVRFLTGYFETRTLTPFAIYCVVAGIGSLIFFAV